MSSILMKYIPRIIFVTIVTIIIIFVIAILHLTNVPTEDLRVVIFRQRVLKSVNGLSYYDGEINRLYPGIIDLEKYSKKLNDDNEALVENLYTAKDVEFITAKLTLKDLTNDKEYVTYYKKGRYQNWVPFSFDEKRFLKADKQKFVLIKDKDNFNPGRLQIEIVTPVG